MVTHICVSELGYMGSLSPFRYQAIKWDDAIEPLGGNFSEISIDMNKLSLRKMYLKMLSANIDHFTYVKTYVLVRSYNSK